MARGTFDSDTNTGSALVHGVLGGVVAGIVFALSEMVMAMLMGMSALVPLQMIGAIALGPGVLPPTEATPTTVFVALVVHMMLSAIYGAVLALAALVIPALRSSIGVLTAVGAVYGLAIWLVNFYVVAPFVFPWFVMASPLVQFIAHVFFFGAVLGSYLGIQLARRRATV